MIEIWYGAEQRFGNAGLPQRWINVLGRVDPNQGGALLIAHYSEVTFGDVAVLPV
ncbi:hypothetical protein ACFL6S_23715 [Candidatus Poribacteria bacterium]